jgi:DNA-binding CsgD family transcriptional regulator
MPKPAKKSAAPPAIRFESITEAEYRILKLLDLGFSNREIAARLGITAGTAKAHLQHLFQKLHVPGRGEALALARESGLV